MGTSPLPSLNTVTPVTKPKQPNRRDLSSHPVYLFTGIPSLRVHCNTTPHGSLQMLDAEEGWGGGFPVYDVFASPIQRRSHLSRTPTSVFCRCSRVQVSRNGYHLAIGHNTWGGDHKQNIMYKYIIVPAVYRIILRMPLVGLHGPF
jgi:hypothetical protein